MLKSPESKQRSLRARLKIFFRERPAAALVSGLLGVVLVAFAMVIAMTLSEEQVARPLVLRLVGWFGLLLIVCSLIWSRDQYAHEQREQNKREDEREDERR